MKLVMRQKFTEAYGKITLEDDNGTVVYRAKWTDDARENGHVTDGDGRELFRIESDTATFFPTFRFFRDDKPFGTIRQKKGWATAFDGEFGDSDLTIRKENKNWVARLDGTPILTVNTIATAVTTHGHYLLAVSDERIEEALACLIAMHNHGSIKGGVADAVGDILFFLPWP